MNNPIAQNRRYLSATIIVVSVFVVGCALHAYRGYYSGSIRTGHSQGADDAFISYRYGWNLAQHGILSWNESGFRRVEGFTNPLWVYISALASLPGHKNLVYPIMVLFSVVVCCCLILLLCRLMRQSNPGSLLSKTGVFLFAASPIVWLHTSSGLESGVFGLLIGTAAWLSLGASLVDEMKVARLLFVLILFAVVLRSDGFVYALPVLLVSLILRRFWWKHVLLAILLGVTVLALWRYFTFESFVPNTAVAKLNFSLHERQYVGREILTRVLFDNGIGVFILVGIVGLSLLRQWRLLLAAAFCLGFWLSYFVYIGGDHFLERHLICVAVFSGAVSAPLWPRLGRSSSILLALGILTFVFAPVLRGDARFSYREKKLPDVWAKMGTLMAQQREEYGTVACGPAGKIPFYAGGDFVDVVGLNDPDLARIPMSSFWPGHSSGSMSKAIEIASGNSSRVSYYMAFPDNRYPTFNSVEMESVAMWFNNADPRIGASGNISTELLAQAAKRPYSLSLIVFCQSPVTQGRE